MVFLYFSSSDNKLRTNCTLIRLPENRDVTEKGGGEEERLVWPPQVAKLKKAQQIF